MVYLLELLGNPEINIKRLVEAFQKGGDRNLLESLGKKGKLPDSLANKLAVFGEVIGLNNPDTILDDLSPVLHHMHFSFLAVFDNELLLSLLENTELYIIRDEVKGYKSIGIITGSLYDWHNALAVSKGNPNLEDFCNKVYKEFNKIGFGKLFHKLIRN